MGGGGSKTTYYPDRISGDYYCSKEQYEWYQWTDARMKNDLAILATDALNRYDKVAPFLPSSWRTSAVNTINNQTSNLPTYVWNPAIMPAERLDHHCEWHEKSYRRRRRNHWHACMRYSPLVINGRRVDAYFHSRNNNFENDMNTRKNIIQNLINDIPTNIYNKCNNPNCLMNSTGMKNCTMDGITMENRYNTMIEKLKITKQHSDYVLSKIQNTNEFPQYSNVKQSADLINEGVNWNPLNTKYASNNSGYTHPQNNIYASLKKYQIEAKIRHYESLINYYTDCKNGSPDRVNNKTRLAFNPTTNNSNNKYGVLPYCITELAEQSYGKCDEAVEMSKIYNYGTEELFGMWTDVSNSLPGQFVNISTDVLNSSKNSCQEWVDMFNVWEELEREAIAKPCIPERPDENANDPGSMRRINSFYESTQTRIEKLKQRLRNIKKYIENYPNVLFLEKKDVILGPHTIPAACNIKYDMKNREEGIAPSQYLEMLLPNGPPGETGMVGRCGSTGLTGKSGIDGETGPTGNMAFIKSY